MELFAVIVQIVGPIMVKFAIGRAGEIGLGDTAKDRLPAERRRELPTGRVEVEGLKADACD